MPSDTPQRKLKQGRLPFSPVDPKAEKKRKLIEEDNSKSAKNLRPDEKADLSLKKDDVIQPAVNAKSSEKENIERKSIGSKSEDVKIETREETESGDERNRELEADEIKRMLADLEGKKNEIESQMKPIQQGKRPGSARSVDGTPLTAAGGVSGEEFSELTRRADQIEHSIGSIVEKINVVLSKLDSMEKTKSKRKENMGKMLDDIMDDKE